MGDADEITVVLADDHAVVRSGLRLLLDQAGLHVLAEAGDAESALRSVLGHKPAVLVLDLNMPGEPTSLEAIPRVADVSPAPASWCSPCRRTRCSPARPCAPVRPATCSRRPPTPSWWRRC